MAEKVDISKFGIKELDDLIARAENRRAELQEKRRQEVAGKIEKLAAGIGMSAAEVLRLPTRSARRKGAPGKKRAPAPVKFRDRVTGKTWSGRGRRPSWVTEEKRVKE